MRGSAGARWTWPVILGWIVVSGCEAPFEPFKESDQGVSIFGALDAATDTQWVRVMPVRQSIFTTPDPLGATVTLERLTNGRTVELRDSVVRFRGGNVQDAISLFTHNFWTTEPIEPGETYRFNVAGIDETSAAVTVAIPEDYSVSVTYSAFDTNIAFVRVRNVDHLGLVLFRRHMPLDCQGWPGPPFYHSVAFEVGRAQSGVYTVGVSSYLDPLIILPCETVKQDLFVVASGAPWPSGLEFDPAALGVLMAAQNVENGVGFLGGILSKPVPWEPCRVEPSSSSGCELVYDSTTVTLDGTVTDDGTGNPIPGAELRLTEVDAEASPPTRYRGATDLEGLYEFGGVPAGVSHVFRVSHQAPCPMGGSQGPRFYLDHVETLPAYGPAERATLNVALERNPACDE